MKHVIIGGVAGGATAAARIRRIDENAEIILLEKGKYISYANCGLPYYIGGVIPERDKLFVQTPSSFEKRFHIDVRVENEAIAIDIQKKTVTVQRKDGNAYLETYDKLLLSPGAYVAKLPIKGIENPAVFTMRTVDDTDKMKNYLETRTVRKACIVGAGFIGLEMVENLYGLGIETSIIEMQPQVLSQVDFSIAAHLHHYLSEKGVKLYLGQTVSHIDRNESQLSVLLQNGEAIATDMVVFATGVRPNSMLAERSQLKIGETGGIWVDSYLQTSAKDVYAIGDAIEYPHPITGKPWLNYLANPANRQGRIAADNMVMGNNQKYEGAIGTAIVKVFDMMVAITGLSGNYLTRYAIPYQSSTTHSMSHAGYYPHASNFTTKLTFDLKTGRLYGAQCVGFEGVDKRIDQSALVIKHSGTVQDLMQLEHAYAPPFSSAKDPIAIAGYVANNIINGSLQVVSWSQILKLDPNTLYILDVRTPEEYQLGSLPNAMNIPLDELRDRLSEIPTDKPVYLFCATGYRGYVALKILNGHGFSNIKNVSGGYRTYSMSVEPINTHFPNREISGVEKSTAHETLQMDVTGMQCPGPILKLKQAIDKLSEGQKLEITASDPGFSRDVEAWCRTTGNVLLSNTEKNGLYKAVVQKSLSQNCHTTSSCDGKAKTFILFSDDLDRALATFVLANGAAATGKKVSIFFTFWGLNVIKKTEKPNLKKDIFGKMFAWMMPSDSLHLKLSKWNVCGIGSRMMRYVMKMKNIESLESLRKQALEQGVEFIACQMSMDVMSVKREELMDEAIVGGVATYMERADQANINLFI